MYSVTHGSIANEIVKIISAIVTLPYSTENSSDSFFDTIIDVMKSTDITIATLGTYLYRVFP